MLRAHQLLFGGRSEMVELEPHLVSRDRLAVGLEVGNELLDDVSVAALELGEYDCLGVNLGSSPQKPHALGRPQPGEAVASRGHLEAEFLIVPEAGFELFLSLFEVRHVLPSIVRGRTIAIE